MKRQDDRGSIVLGWLTKIALVLGVLAVLAFDGISLVRTEFTAADHANSAASAAADVYAHTHDVQKAYDAALALAIPQSETIDPKTFTVRATDGHVLLTLRREAQTLWLYRIGPLKKYVTQSALGEGGPPS